MNRLLPLLLPLAVLMSLSTALPAADLSEADQAEVTRVTREWDYLRDRALRASVVASQAAALPPLLTETAAALEAAKTDPAAALQGREQALRRLATLSAQINAAVAPGKLFTAGFTPAYSRQDPTAIVPPDLPQTTELLALPGEHPAAAILVANTQDQPLALRVTTVPTAALTLRMRRHVFMENWYRRAKARATDPLCLLPRDGNAWVLNMQPGEVIQLHLELEVASSARGLLDCPVTLTAAAAPAQTLALSVRVLGSRPPANSPFEHLAFMYPEGPIAGHSPVPVAHDLAAHGVTMIEYPSMPKSTFAADGRLLTADFSRHEALLRNFGPDIRRFLIFWWGELKSEDGQVWPMLSPGWRVAFANLLEAWFAHAAKLGYGQDRFVIMPFDEPSSHQLAEAPKPLVHDLAATMAHLKQRFPRVPTVATLSYYAYMPDLRVYLPHLDLAIAHWPWPERLGPKFAPPEHNPAKVFFAEMLPLLEQRRKESGMQITSYHVASGKEDDLLSGNRAYPALMVGLGLTGIAHWAYNNISGSSWHDWDGKPWLDYLFVYDGTENHPLNRQYNPTGETVVTSLRWEAVRAGVEEARLLLYLRQQLEAGRLAPRDAERVQQMLSDFTALARGTTPLTEEGYERAARRLRLLYTQLVPARPAD